ncbi:MAG: Na(+)-translocating NADH-quinone reductase subunit F [Flavobacteriaceae bacterium]|nr:Na(+)-translocating NADH-quinone reductase subunit F [Flavobacteriaceae bacterium]
METPARLEHAISKLYRAFHGNTLQPQCCNHCAVGNILDNTDAWRHLTEGHGTTRLSYVGIVHQRLGRTFQGYTPAQLLQVESIFLSACGFTASGTRLSTRNKISKERLFQGLVAVVTYLCELDGVPNVMDYSKLFEVEHEQPKYALEEVV